MAQPLNATFFAFRKREKSGVLTRATIGVAIGMIVISVVFFAAFSASLIPLVQWYGGLISAAATNDVAAMETIGFPAALGGFVLGAILWMFALFILLAAFEAACLRWMIHGESGGGLLGLTFGADTWRVYSSYWLWFLLYLAFSIVVGMIVGAVMVPIVMSAATSGGELDPFALQTHPAVLAVNLLQYVLMAYFGVRLAPASAASIARKKFAFFDAWKITRGRFWALFGSFLLLFVIYFVAIMIFYVVMFATILSSVAPTLMQIGTDPTQLAQAEVRILEAYVQAFSEPSNWAIIGVMYVLMTFVGLMFYIACYGVNARATIAALEEGKITPPAA